MKDALFCLLRLGLGNSKPHNEDLSSYISLKERQWEEIIMTATNQGVIGVVLDGIVILSLDFDVIRNSGWFYDAIGEVVYREKRNEQQIEVMKELSSIWKKGDIIMMVMKGQANGLYYPNPKHRDCDDMDCYLMGDHQKGEDIIKKMGLAIDESWDKHSEFIFKGECIENHQFFVNSLNKRWRENLDAELFNLTKVEDYSLFPESDILLPPIQFHALFLTYHAMTHFLAGNMKLKQVLDWAMFVKTEKKKIKWKEFVETCRIYKMEQFLYVMNHISNKLLGIIIPNEFCSNNDKQLKKFVDDILYNNDYVYDLENIGRWHGRIHYVKYVFNNRWKYNLAGIPLWKQLWDYFSSYKERN